MARRNPNRHGRPDLSILRRSGHPLVLEPARCNRSYDAISTATYLMAQPSAILLGLALNAYPAFDPAHTRMPGILQRIGLCFGITSTLVLLTSKTDVLKGLIICPRVIAALALFILLFYWLLLFAVPVPGFGAPRLDAVGSWPVVVDRVIFGPDHMWVYGTTDGTVTYDPEGLLSTLPACFNVLLGVLAGHAYTQKYLKRPALTALVVGVSLMALALLVNGICPIIKSIWTSSFALFSGGFSLFVLASLTVFLNRFKASTVLLPARVYGSNALLAFVICWLLMPVIDAPLIHVNDGMTSIRQICQATLRSFMEDSLASLVFSLCYLGVLFLILWGLYKKRWFLKL